MTVSELTKMTMSQWKGKMNRRYWPYHKRFQLDLKKRN